MPFHLPYPTLFRYAGQALFKASQCLSGLNAYRNVRGGAITIVKYGISTLGYPNHCLGVQHPIL